MYPGQLKNIRLMAPEAHDLALMKLDRNIERDREDVGFWHEGPYAALPEQRLDKSLAL
jgi:hypothetical protein